MRLLAPLLLAALAGCYAPNVGNGSLPCSSDRKCPQGFTCQPDDNCWLPGSGPDLSMDPDLAAPSDADLPADLPIADLATADLAVPDLARPPDLRPPPDLAVPPDKALPPDLSPPSDLAASD